MDILSKDILQELLKIPAVLAVGVVAWLMTKIILALIDIIKFWKERDGE